jgi:hypothetical protein
MNLGYGIPASRKPLHDEVQQAPARYLVLIESGGVKVARLFLATRVAVAEFDAGAEEVTRMTSALLPTNTANQPEWDEALAGHSDTERQAADVYTLQL